MDKHFGTIVSVVIPVIVTAYTAIHISDQYFSSIPGSEAERRRLAKERLKEENKMLGKWEGFWMFWFPSTHKKDGKIEDIEKT